MRSKVRKLSSKTRWWLYIVVVVLGSIIGGFIPGVLNLTEPLNTITVIIVNIAVVVFAYWLFLYQGRK